MSGQFLGGLRARSLDIDDDEDPFLRALRDQRST
jgi:hypothetical protein